MAEQPWEPESPNEDLPQDPGIPGGPPAPEREPDDGLTKPDSPRDPPGIDAPGSPSPPPPEHGPWPERDE
jgi:hypothetical protein